MALSASIPVTSVPDLFDVLELATDRARIDFYDHITDTHRTGIDILGLGGNTSDINSTTIRLADSISQWEMSLTSLAEMRSMGALARHRRPL